MPIGTLPCADDALQMYRNSAGGHLTEETNFGVDSLEEQVKFFATIASGSMVRN